MADDLSQFPAQAQAAQLLAASGQLPPPPPPSAKEMKLPSFENSAPAAAVAQDVQQLPSQPAPPPAEPPPDKIPTFEESTPVAEPFDTSVMGPTPSANEELKRILSRNMEDYFKSKHLSGTAANWLEAFEAGIQSSATGLLQQKPDAHLPPDPTFAMRIANQVGSLAGDLPFMMAGGFAGPGAAFALPAAVRKTMMDHYEKGEISSAGDFVDRLLGTSWEASKAFITGEATAFAGGLAGDVVSTEAARAAQGLASGIRGGALLAKPVIGEAAKFMSEVGTMTTVGAALEGHLPSLNHFIDAAVVMGGLHGVTVMAPKLSNIYSRLGEHPSQVAAEVAKDPILLQEMMSPDKEVPEAAAPNELKEHTIGEGEAAKIQSVLVPKDLSVKPPEVSPPKDRTPEMQTLADKIGKEPELPKGSFTDKVDEFYAKSVDWTDPQKVAYAAWKSMTGKELPAEDLAYIQSRLFAGHNDFIRRVVEEGIPDENGIFSGRGINSIYRDVEAVGGNQGDFDLYSLHKRAMAQYERGISPWKDFDPTQSQKAVEDYSPLYEKFHQERVQAQNDLISYGVRKGVIDPGKAQASIESEKDYIPMNKILEPDEITGLPPSAGADGILRKFTGDSDLFFKNPRMQIYNNFAAILKRADINDIRVKFHDNMKVEDENGFMTNPWTKEVGVKGNINPNTQIPIFREGKLSALEGTPLVIDSLKRLEGDQTSLNLTMKVAKGLATSLRMGTILDPAFGLRHFFRSAVLSGVYSQTGQIPFIHPVQVLGEFLGGKSEDYKNWLSKGGATQGFDELDNSYIANDLEGSEAKAPWLNQAWNVLKTPLEASETFIKMTDNLTRFTEYKRAIEQGKSPTEAAFLGREVTPDFSKVGLQRSALRTITAFQGAHITSLARMGQSFKEDPYGTALKMTAAITVPSLLLYAANKDNKNIDGLPNFQKDLYWNIPVQNLFAPVDSGTPETIIKLPKPWGPGILFGSGVERTLDHYFKQNPDSYKDFVYDLATSFVPPIIPSGITPILEHVTNYNIFKGANIVNEQQKRLMPELQYTPMTSPSAIELSKLCEKVPLVKDIGPSSHPLCSPEIIENYVRGLTGTLGGYMLKVADEGLRAAGVIPKNTGPTSVDTPIAEYPILSGFMTRFPTMKTQPIQDFYRNVDETSIIMNSVKFAQKTGNVSAMQSILSQYPQLEPQLTGYAKAIAVGRKTIQLIQDNPNYTPIQKRQAVDQMLFQIGSIANMGNQMMRDFKTQINKAGEGK